MAPARWSGKMPETATMPAAGIADRLDLLRCPKTGEALRREGQELVSVSGAARYRLTDDGIPLLADLDGGDAAVQSAHYETISAAYLANLGYAHTQEYLAYLDRVLIEACADAPLGTVAEICCGSGEALRLLRGRYRRGVGVDISVSMLKAARRGLAGDDILFVHGDATRLPLADARFDAVFCLGGIHHVNDRARLFREVARILKPGGRFYWREPLNDFVLWRMLRAVIYRLSPLLDAETERPLRRAETQAALTAAGLAPGLWRGCGLIGFCLFMNSDVLVFNRGLRHVPGIGRIVRAFIAVDEMLLRIPGLGAAALQVVGYASKPRG